MIIQTLYSPYQMAKQAVPWELLVKHVKEDPEAVCRGMENVTLSILNFVQAAAKRESMDFIPVRKVGKRIVWPTTNYSIGRLRVLICFYTKKWPN